MLSCNNMILLWLHQPLEALSTIISISFLSVEICFLSHTFPLCYYSIKYQRGNEIWVECAFKLLECFSSVRLSVSLAEQEETSCQRAGVKNSTGLCSFTAELPPHFFNSLSQCSVRLCVCMWERERKYMNEYKCIKYAWKCACSGLKG